MDDSENAPPAPPAAAPPPLACALPPLPAGAPTDVLAARLGELQRMVARFEVDEGAAGSAATASRNAEVLALRAQVAGAWR
jgi:hypothetical protein